MWISVSKKWEYGSFLDCLENNGEETFDETEITEIDPTSFSDLCTYLWCCVASAAKREGRQFDMPLMDFADNLMPEDMTQWSEAIKGEDEPDDGATV